MSSLLKPKITLKNNTSLTVTTIKNNTSLTVLDLFCGCGGFAEGLTQSGLKILCGIDIWATAIET